MNKPYASPHSGNHSGQNFAKRRGRDWWDRARKSPSFIAGALLVGLLFCVAALSLVWTPYVPGVLDVQNKLQAASMVHWMGTDAYGHDVATQLMVGAQSAIVVGVVALAIGVIFGMALGLIAAAKGGWWDEFVMRCADLTFAFPAILLAIMLTSVYGSGVVVSIAAIGIASIAVFARLVRGAAKSVWQQEYVAAARACGKSTWQITWAHVLPNIRAVVMVQATTQFAIAILAEAALSYLGMGTQYPTPSWGRMLSEAQTLMFDAPMLAVYPGVAIALAVLGFNLLGDGLRDVLDPRL